MRFWRCSEGLVVQSRSCAVAQGGGKLGLRLGDFLIGGKIGGIWGVGVAGSEAL